MLRTFIAIEIPKEIQDKLTSAIDSIRNPKDKITWVSAGNIHLTLKFLGNISEDDIDSIKKILGDISLKHSPFQAAITGLGMFPSEKSPRIIWAGIGSNAEKIKDIYKDIEEMLAIIGIAKENRDFTPHFTLGRVKYIKDLKIFADSISKHNEDSYGKINVDSISLIKSTLTPRGSIYEAIYKAEFKK